MRGRRGNIPRVFARTHLNTSYLPLLFKMYNEPVKPPPNPIAIRPDLITSEETTLRLHPKANTHSATDYTIKDVATGSTIFSVTGKKYGSSPGREFRDSTGLPLFELHRVGISRKPWRVRLPGDKERDLISICMRGPSMKIKLEIAQNCAATAGGQDGKREGEDMETVKMEVRRTTALFTFDVLAGEQKVADVRENAEINHSIGHSISGPYDYAPPKRVLDINLAEGLDMSIV